MSNSGPVLTELTAAGQKLAPIEKPTKALGVQWDPRDDTLSFNVAKIIEKNPSTTKRTILRVIMQIYDPLGLISNWVIGGKLVLREVWRTDCGWDDIVPAVITESWVNWLRMLQGLHGLRILRWCGIVEEHRELHVFVDASDRAVAAVAYMCGQSAGGKTSYIVAAKSRVAPMRQISVPRLELQAAVLGVRVAAMVVQAAGAPIGSTTFWTDAKDVIWWINSAKRKYKPYVAIRISEILVHSRPADWKWIPGKQNPADLATKPVKNEPVQASLWLEGPSFLRKDATEWPCCKDSDPKDPNLEIVKVLHIRPTRIETRFTGDPYRISGWLKLVRVTAWARRFARHLFRKKGPLEAEEIKEAQLELFKEAQSDFGEERKAVAKGQLIPKSSEVHRLTMFTDPEDPRQLLRLKSRLMRSRFLPYTTRVPIVLPRQNMITRRLVEFYHQEVGHQNHETTINLLRRQFVIVRLRSLLNQVIRGCQQCAIFLAKPEPPQMASLPMERLSFGCKPFFNTGIDCFGPIYVTSRRRKEKRWGLILTCLTTRAIDIEVLVDMSGKDCVAALTRFANRWGVPHTIRCDNGTNFVWAARKFRGREGEEPIWKFNPPLASHMGGA